MEKWTLEQHKDSRQGYFSYSIPEAGYESYTVDDGKGEVAKAGRLIASAPALLDCVERALSFGLIDDEEAREIVKYVKGEVTA